MLAGGIKVLHPSLYNTVLKIIVLRAKFTPRPVDAVCSTARRVDATSICSIRRVLDLSIFPEGAPAPPLRPWGEGQAAKNSPKDGFPLLSDLYNPRVFSLVCRMLSMELSNTYRLTSWSAFLAR